MRTFSKVALWIGFAVTCSGCSGGSGSPINSMPNQPSMSDSASREPSAANLHARPRYTATLLPANFEPSPPFSVMQDGAVPGAAGNQAALYRSGHITLLGSYNGFRTMATSVNSRGDVVGWAESPDGLRDIPLFFSGGHITVLRGADGDVYYQPSSINDSDQIVGTCGLPVASGQVFADLCIFSLNGSAQDLGRAGIMSNINAYGEFGASVLQAQPSASFAALGTGTTLRLIFAPRQYKGNPLSNSTSWINNFGDIVGSTTPVTAPNNFVSYIIKSGHLSLINTPGETQGTTASAINDSNQVVGTYWNGNSSYAFYWESGTLYDLKSLVAGAPPNLTFGSGIDDNSNILAASSEHWYLLRRQ